MSNYLVIGTGATGSCIGAYLAKAGHNVHFIARGAHLSAIREQGLSVTGSRFGDFTVAASACAQEDYTGTADVIFVCVKAYSLEEILPLLRRACKEDTLIVPILNGLGIGDRIRAAIPGARVLDACLYINARIAAPGVIAQSGKAFRIICADHTDGYSHEAVEALAQEWKDAGIDVRPSDNILRDQFRKFMFVSPLAATQLYFDVTTGPIQQDEAIHAFFVALVEELDQLAAQQGIVFPVDMVEDGKKRLAAMPDSVMTSLYLDVKNGKRAEVEEQILTPVRKGAAVGLAMEHYRKVAKKLALPL